MPETTLILSGDLEPTAQRRRHEMTRNEKIAGLRELADWLEAHPEAPVPSASREFSYYVLVDNDTAGVARVRDIAEPLGLSVTVGETEAFCSRTFPGGLAWVARYLYRDRVRKYDALMSYADAVAVE